MDTFLLDRLIFMLKGKSLLDYINSFSPNDYEKNDRIFSITKKMEILYFFLCSKSRKFKNPKISYILKKTVLPIICSKSKNEEKKYLKRKIILRY